VAFPADEHSDNSAQMSPRSPSGGFVDYNQNMPTPVPWAMPMDHHAELKRHLAAYNRMGLDETPEITNNNNSYYNSNVQPKVWLHHTGSTQC